MNDDREQLAVVLENLASGNMSRDEAEAWATVVFEEHGGTRTDQNPFGNENIDYYWTWRIVASARFRTRTGNSLDAAEYFFRPSDFAEWAARTRDLDPPSSSQDLFPLRPHQCERLFEEVPAFCLIAPFEHFRAVLGETVRGLDGLDFLDQYLLGSRWGVKYLLQSHAHDQSVAGFAVNLPFDADREETIPPLLAALQLPREAVERINAAPPQ